MLALLSLVSMSAGGYVYYKTAQQSALKEVEGEASTKTRLLQQRVQELISFHHKDLHALSRFEELREVIVNRNEKSLAEANRVLDHFAEGLNFEVCFLLDRTGTAIASSNRNTPESFVGHDYSFRPYFTSALEGEPATHMALGVVTHRVGLFLSHPVYIPGGSEPKGVVAAKVSLDSLERSLSLFDGTIVLLVHDNGIITLSIGKDWLLHSLWKSDPKTMEAIAQTRQFGKGPWIWTGLTKTGRNRAVDRLGEVYVLDERNLENCPGWRIVCLYRVRTMFGKIVNPLAGKIGYAALALFLVLGGSVTFFFFMAERDLRDRQRAEEAVRQSEEWYRALVENSFDGIFTQKGSKIVFANSRLYDMLGYSKGELEGLDHWLVYHPEYHKITRERAMARMRGEEVAPQYEVKLQRKDGSSFDGEISARAVKVKGEPGVQVWVKDISRRKRSEEVQRRLATAVEQAAEAIVITDPQGIIQYVNPSVEQISGYRREEVLGKTTSVFKSGLHDQAFYKHLRETIKRGEVWTGRFINKRKDGSLYHEEATISPVRGASGEIMNFVAVKRDITEHLEISRQLLQAQKMEAIGTLAGGIAHDFNNLLQVVQGYTDLLLLRKSKEDPDYDKLRTMRGAAQRGRDLVQQILAFSRKVETKPRPVDLNNELRQTELLLQRTIEKMISIEMDLAGNLWPISADPVHIEQILLNLAVNAKHAMPQGGRLMIETKNIKLDEEYCRTHLKTKPGRYVLLTVSDTGHGMDKEVLERIFEPFFTTKETGEGTGLGLAMVFGLVKSHNGHISCYSEPGIGTTFKIYFPAIDAESEWSVETTQEMPAFGTETLLVVDDEESIRELMKEILSEVGYRVLTAASGREAIDTYSKVKEAISLVILDLIMPGMDGKACLEELLRINPDVKILLASGYSANGPARQAIASGAKGLITKPYDIRQLLRMVRAVIDAE